jgi:DNA polymerase-4
MPRTILHVDMDAFFASIEQRDSPEYRGKPVIVGSPPDQRGVVCAASYEARKFKVRSAMPSRTAAKLCPHGIFVRPRMEVYRAESSLIMDILRSFTPLVERMSVDEAYLDVSEMGDAVNWPERSNDESKRNVD